MQQKYSDTQRLRIWFINPMAATANYWMRYSVSMGYSSITAPSITLDSNLIPLTFEPCIDDEHGTRRKPFQASGVDEPVKWPPTLILSSVLINLGPLFYKLSFHFIEGTSALIILLMCNESLVWS